MNYNEIVFDLLKSLDSHSTLSKQLSTNIEKGYFLLAKTRYSSPSSKTSLLEFKALDLKEKHPDISLTVCLEGYNHTFLLVDNHDNSKNVENTTDKLVFCFRNSIRTVVEIVNERLKINSLLEKFKKMKETDTDNTQ